MLKRICAAAHTDESRIVAAYRYGSRVYGTARPDSDHDVILLVKDGRDGHEIRNGDLNIHIYTPAHFASQLAGHGIAALECFFLPDSMILKAAPAFPFRLDRAILRRELSAKASHSWSKAHKKITVENELLLGRKSLFHALRILEFGSQMARDGRITDYAAANPLFVEIMEGPEDWATLKAIWQPRFNALSSEFRRLAPKT